MALVGGSSAESSQQINTDENILISTFDQPLTLLLQQPLPNRNKLDRADLKRKYKNRA